MTNFTANAGSGGSTFTSDTEAGAEVPVVKIMWGAAGSGQRPTDTAGQALPVDILRTPAATTGNITSAATTIGPVTLGDNDGLSVVVSGTYAGVNFGFWASNDNAVWWPVAAARSDSGVVETTTGVLTANKTQAWDISIGEALYFKVVSTAWTSGSAAINITPGMMAAEPVPSAIVTGPVAAGSALAGFPVQVGGSDGTNIRALKTDASGNVFAVLLDSAGTNKGTIKAASAAAAAADTALVVAQSPNHAISSNLVISTTAAANTALTATLPAAGAGLFHYIDRIEITRNATAALAGTATLVITTTNLPGSLAWSVGNAMAAGGTQTDVNASFPTPLKASAANVATTIVCPAPGAAVLWRINVFYHTGI